MKKRKLDFENLPVAEVAAILRRIIEKITEQLLVEISEPGLPLKEESPLELESLLTKKEFLLLDHSNTWKLKFKWFVPRIPASFRDELPRALKKIIKRAVNPNKKITISQWETALSDRLALALGGTSGDGLPDGLWPIAGKTAWNDPVFLHSINLRVATWLKKTQVFYPFHIPIVQFKLPTFWILIAISRPRSFRFITLFSRTERAMIRVCRRLYREAHLEAMVNGWAEFWDQWLLSLAIQRWPKGFKQLDTRLCKALVAMPMIGNRDWTQHCTAKGKLKLYHRSLGEWIIDKIDRIRRRRRPAREFHRVALLHLTAPGWENRIPELFANLKFPESLL